MKKIALMCFNYDSCLSRAEAFIKNGDKYEIDLVCYFEREFEEEYLGLPKYYEGLKHAKIKSFSEINLSDYDLALPMTDKLGDKWLDLCYPGTANINNKVHLQKEIKRFGKLQTLRTSPTNDITEFKDDDVVMMKPAVAAGAWSDNPLCYTKISFGEVKQYFDDPNFVIQEYVDSHDVIMISYMSNGSEIVQYDLTEQVCKPSPSGNLFFPYMRTVSTSDGKYDAYIELGKNFLEFVGYTKVRTVYNIQYLLKGDDAYVIDVNLRCGPVTVVLELLGIINTKAFKGLEFLLDEPGAKDRLIDASTYQTYHMFARDLSTNKLLTDKIEDVGLETAVKISENKSSGCIRNDVGIFVQPL